MELWGFIYDLRDIDLAAAGRSQNCKCGVFYFSATLFSVLVVFFLKKKKQNQKLPEHSAFLHDNQALTLTDQVVH